MEDDNKWYQRDLLHFFKNSQLFKCTSLFVTSKDFVMLRKKKSFGVIFAKNRKKNYQEKEEYNMEKIKSGKLWF